MSSRLSVNFSNILQICFVGKVSHGTGVFDMTCYLKFSFFKVSNLGICELCINFTLFQVVKTYFLDWSSKLYSFAIYSSVGYFIFILHLCRGE